MSPPLTSTHGVIERGEAANKKLPSCWRQEGSSTPLRKPFDTTCEERPHGEPRTERHTI